MRFQVNTWKIHTVARATRFLNVPKRNPHGYKRGRKFYQKFKPKNVVAKEKFPTHAGLFFTLVFSLLLFSYPE